MGWITTRWISAPRMKPISGATMKPEPEISGRLQREPRQHGADHEEVAVRNVDDVEQAENDRKAERDQRDDQPPDQAVHRKQQQRIHHDATRSDARANGFARGSFAINERLEAMRCRLAR